MKKIPAILTKEAFLLPLAVLLISWFLKHRGWRIFLGKSGVLIPFIRSN